MRLLLAPALSAFVLLATGCCLGGGPGGEGIFGKSARESFIPSFNKNGIKGCNLSGRGQELKELEYSCKLHTLAELERAVVPACSGFKMVGFEKLTVLGKDGTANVNLDGGCKFARK